jgi:hypothetical protein
MAEWLMRGTVNTFFRGSIPLDALKKNSSKKKEKKKEFKIFLSLMVEQHSSKVLVLVRIRKKNIYNKKVKRNKNNKLLLITRFIYYTFYR